MTAPAWIGTSWKMNKSLAEAKDFATQLIQDDQQYDSSIQRFVIPPFTLLRDVKRILAETNVMVGAQNMHWQDHGAWTGEVSPLMLKDCAMDIVELGHSERRKHFGETNDTVGLKVEAAVRHGLIPLICVGETLQEREAANADAVLRKQVQAAFAHLNTTQKSAPLLLAYEPVWAIGDHGIPASPDYANDRQAAIKTVAEEILGKAVPCLYGGSVNPDNCVELFNQAYIDGLFIGRSAWHVEGYLNILNRCSNASKFNQSEN